MNLLAAQTIVPARMSDAISPMMGVFFVSFAVTLILTPLMRKLAIRNGIVDWPDLKRKAHIEPIAYLGGVALFLGWLAGVVFCGLRQYQLGVEDFHQIRFPITIILGATIITITGLADDVFGMSPRVKIGGQFLAAAALTWKSQIGVHLARSILTDCGWPGAPYLLIYIFGAAMITFLVVGGCNALNLLDGLDGLAAGVSGITALGFLYIAAHVAMDPTLRSDAANHPVRIAMCLAILGAVLGFLPYNSNPANIFMGDAGSLLLGYLSVATILMFSSVPNRGPLLVMASLIIFGLPIADTTLAIVRRKMRGQPIFSPDNQHLHHLFLRAAKRLELGPNASVKIAVGAMYLLAMVFAFLGCALWSLRWRYVMATFGVVFGFIIVTAYKAGHRHALMAKLQTPAAPPPAADKPVETASSSAKPPSRLA